MPTIALLTLNGHIYDVKLLNLVSDCSLVELPPKNIK